MEDKHDREEDREKIGQSAEEDMIGSADDEFEDVEDVDADEEAENEE